MKPDRHFLDWNKPLAHQVRAFLIPEPPTSAVDLSSSLVLIPTRQAGRHLRENLALYCSHYGTALLPPVVQEPMGLLRSLDDTAGPLASLSIWINMLQQIQPEDFGALFPHAPPAQDFTWAMRTAELIQRLRHTLVDGGLLIRDVCHQHSETLEEPGRWEDLNRLETKYLEALQAAGLRDRCAALIEASAAPLLDDKLDRIVVAGVPDPTPLVLRALESLAERYPVDILIHAPESHASHFDLWGRPDTSYWTSCEIPIRDPDTTIHIAANPADQAARMRECIVAEQTSFGPHDLAIGVPDAEVSDYIATQLSTLGLVAFNPAGHLFREHRIYHFLACIRDIIAHPSYEAVAACLRHPDVLYALREAHGITSEALLASLDTFQNKHIPQTIEDMDALAGLLPEGHALPLKEALSLIHTLRDLQHADSLQDLIAQAMTLIYAHQTVNPQTPEGESFVAIAQQINRMTEEMGKECFLTLNLRPHEALQILLQALDKESWYEDSRKSQVDLEGWLELPWNDAPLLIVTGMNDGRVPDGRTSDVFLPDSLLRQLGLRCDRDRLARDAYLMTTLTHARENEGRVYFMAGRFSRTGDPLQPSRLLFRCADTHLPERVRHIFSEQETGARLYPATVGFLLDPAQAKVRHLSSIGVTSFRSYLACPFRFYLSYAAQMESLADNAQEMDALVFGHMIHHALEGLKDQPTLSDGTALETLFLTRAEAWLRAQFGARPPLPVLMQYESIRQRLMHAARVQAELIAQGWVPTLFEVGVEATIRQTRIKGRMDRVDYHPDLKQWRVIDYKTTDTVTTPLEAHMGPWRDEAPDFARAPGAWKKKKDGRWIDLQLPLYHDCFQTQHPDEAISTAYFVLPRAVTETSLLEWTEVTPDLLTSARACAEAIVQRIEQHEFWPPNDTIKYDEFEDLFPFPASQCVKPLVSIKGDVS
jgi:ATP-dependent helicase/nuclease subunit B